MQTNVSIFFSKMFCFCVITYIDHYELSQLFLVNSDSFLLCGEQIRYYFMCCLSFHLFSTSTHNSPTPSGHNSTQRQRFFRPRTLPAYFCKHLSTRRIAKVANGTIKTCKHNSLQFKSFAFIITTFLWTITIPKQLLPEFCVFQHQYH